jgi:ABC-type branched-subunit amino acid transport system ATPase component
MVNGQFGGPAQFGIFVAFALMFAVAIGGITGPYGPIIGTFVVFGFPLVGGSGGQLLSAGIGLGGLTIILVSPMGLYGIWVAGRDRLVHWLLGADTADEGDEAEQAVEIEAPQPRSIQESPSTRDGAQHNGPVLEAIGLYKQFGGVEVLRGVDLSVERGEIVTLIGPNGAGKTTTFDVLSGFVRPDQGSVTLGGEDVTTLSAPDRAQLGLVRTFQDAALFATLTVREVLHLAASAQSRHLIAGSLIGVDPGRRSRDREVASALARFNLTSYQHHRIAQLSTGTRRIVELASALLLRADVLLLDEPTAGIAQREVERLGTALRQFRDDVGTTIVVIEHDIPFCSAIADRMVVLTEGQVLVEGTHTDVTRNPLVIESYLGADQAAISRSGSET